MRTLKHLLILTAAVTIAAGTTWVYAQQQRHRAAMSSCRQRTIWRSINSIASTPATWIPGRSGVRPGCSPTTAWPTWAEEILRQEGAGRVLRRRAEAPVGGHPALQLHLCDCRNGRRRSRLFVHDAGRTAQGRRAGRSDHVRQVTRTGSSRRPTDGASRSASGRPIASGISTAPVSASPVPGDK